MRVCAFKSNLFTILRTSLNDVDVKHIGSLMSVSFRLLSSSSISFIVFRISSRLLNFKSVVSPKLVIILALFDVGGRDLEER